MIFDLIVAGIILLFAIFGYFSGALKQIFKIGVLILAYVLSKPASLYLLPILEEHVSLPKEIAPLIARSIALFLLAIIFGIIAMILVKLLYKVGDEGLAFVDRLGGIVLSALKAGIMIYLIFGVILTYRLTIESKGWVKPEFFNKSFTLGLIENNNLAKKFFWIDYTGRLSDCSLFPDIQMKMAQDKKLEIILMKPEYQKYFKDGAPKGGGNIMNSPFAREIIQDKDFQTYIMSDQITEWLDEAKKGRKKK